MRISTDSKPLDVSLQRILNVVTEAGTIAANALANAIASLEEKDGVLHVAWKSIGPDEFQAAIDEAWLKQPGSPKSIQHHDNPAG
jgi:hypothetical protein